MSPIAIFYHCLFMHGNPPTFREHAASIVKSQMGELKEIGLLDAASEMLVGINGDSDCGYGCIPEKAKVVWHGLESKAENLTIVEIEKWLPNHSGWYVLYFHSKGCTHTLGTPDEQLRSRWRKCMMKKLIANWRQCIADLDSGYESVGCHWMTGSQTPPGQSIWAGNFWWAKSDYLSTLPSIYDRERIKISGIASVESRYESEVWIGNGLKLPRVKDYHPAGFTTCP